MLKKTIISLFFARVDIQPSNQVKLLGVLLDEKLTFTAHVGALCKSTYFHIRALRHIRQTLSTNDEKTVAIALVGSRLDYANSILYGPSAASISKLQRIQNSLARVVTCSKPRSGATRLLKDLHWLPIQHRINFKIATITFKTRLTLKPLYLSALVLNYVPGRDLRSTDGYLLQAPRTRTVTGSRAFRSAAQKACNELPVDIRAEPSLFSFCRKLKTFYFKIAFAEAL